MMAYEGQKIYIGTPYIQKAKVACSVLSNEKSDKVVSLNIADVKVPKQQKVIGSNIPGLK